MKLGVNIDHIAVLREARKVNDPDPLDALPICKRTGIEQITIHLREDRRHMQDIDAKNIILLSSLPVNFECAIESSMIDIACKFGPHRATLVPEKRKEITTEGGLLITGKQKSLKKAIKRLHDKEIDVSLFIDPTSENVEISSGLGVEWIELHTGRYANIYAMLYSGLSKTKYSVPELDISRKRLKKMLADELENLKTISVKAQKLGLKVAAGHGLNYDNVSAIVDIGTIEELNIGQSIIARSVYTGLERAILEMKSLLAQD